MNNIRCLRELSGYTQTQLARKLNVCQQAVAKWESGLADPKWELAPKIATILMCELDDLFSESA